MPRPRVLCVDDQADNLQLRVAFLRRLGWKAVGVTDRRSAMRIAGRRRVDACVLDYRLNNGDTGENVAQDLRAMRPEMPLILLTGEICIPQSARDSVDQVLIKGLNSTSELASTLTFLLAGIPCHETRAARKG